MAGGCACATWAASSKPAASRLVARKLSRQVLMPGCSRPFRLIRLLHKKTRRTCGAPDKRNRWKVLPDGRTAPVGEYNRPAGLDDRRVLRRHDVRAKIKLARRDADHGDQQRSDKSNDLDLEMRGAVCPIKGPVHNILRGSTPWSPRPEKFTSSCDNVAIACEFPRPFTDR